MANIITVQGVDIKVDIFGEDDYICITDMNKAKDGDFFVSDWLRNRNTVEFISIWEQIHNPNFNYGESAIIKSKVGLNSFKISVKEWVERTNAIGLVAKAGRYGGTYAHKDIAFEFGMWISPEFKLYLIKEFQRLKENEATQHSQEWSARRTLVKAQYHVHTDAVKTYLIPAEITVKQSGLIYANEADILNQALFGMTAKEWRAANPDKKGNIRDYATIEQLIVLSSLESQNAVLIEQGIPAEQRLLWLNQAAIKQMKQIVGSATLRQFAQLSNNE